MFLFLIRPGRGRDGEKTRRCRSPVTMKHFASPGQTQGPSAGAHSKHAWNWNVERSQDRGRPMPK